MSSEKRQKDAERIAAVMVAELERKRLVAALTALADKLAYPTAAGAVNEFDKGFYVARMSAAAGIRAVLIDAGALTKAPLEPPADISWMTFEDVTRMKPPDDDEPGKTPRRRWPWWGLG